MESLHIEDNLTKGIHIKDERLPGQHHIATIGVHGATMKVGEQQLPAYHVFVGGAYGEGEMRLATQLKVQLPARRGSEAVERFIELYQKYRNPGETF